MRIAVAGKGGSGKTTIAGTLARALAQAGRAVTAVDADTNPNLGPVLGLDPNGIQEVAGLPRDLLERRTDPDGTVRTVFTGDPDEIIREFGVTAPDGVRMIVMGRIDHGGGG